MSTRETQADRVLELLEWYHLKSIKENYNLWCPLPKIMQLGIACHTRRISDLRKRGHVIECQRETVDGQVRTKYRLVR